MIEIIPDYQIDRLKDKSFSFLTLELKINTLILSSVGSIDSMTQGSYFKHCKILVKFGLSQINTINLIQDSVHLLGVLIKKYPTRFQEIYPSEIQLNLENKEKLECRNLLLDIRNKYYPAKIREQKHQSEDEILMTRINNSFFEFISLAGKIELFELLIFPIREDLTISTAPQMQQLNRRLLTFIESFLVENFISEKPAI